MLGIPDLDREILYRLDPPNLEKIRRYGPYEGPYIEKIYTDPVFWYNMIWYNFGLKPTNRTKDNYELLYYLNILLENINPTEPVSPDNLQIMRLLLHKEFIEHSPVQGYAMDADNQLEMINHLLMSVLTGSVDAYHLAQLYNIKFDNKDANYAALLGQLEMIEWLSEQNIFPDYLGAAYAAGTGQIEILDWLWEHGIYPDDADFVQSIYGGVDTIKWFYDHGYPKSNGIGERAAQKAADDGRIEELRFLMDIGHLPTNYIFPLLYNHDDVILMMLDADVPIESMRNLTLLHEKGYISSEMLQSGMRSNMY